MTIGSKTIQGASSGGAFTTTTQVASSVANIVYTDLLAGSYELEWYGVRPATDGARLRGRISQDNGSTYKATGYDSNLIYARSSAGTGNFIDTEILMGWTTGNAGNEACAGSMKFSLLASEYTSFSGLGAYLDAAAACSQFDFGAFYDADTTTIDAIEFAFSSGNIAAGTFKLRYYGVN